MMYLIHPLRRRFSPNRYLPMSSPSKDTPYSPPRKVPVVPLLGMSEADDFFKEQARKEGMSLGWWLRKHGIISPRKWRTIRDREKPGLDEGALTDTDEGSTIER